MADKTFRIKGEARTEQAVRGIGAVETALDNAQASADATARAFDGAAQSTLLYGQQNTKLSSQIAKPLLSLKSMSDGLADVKAGFEIVTWAVSGAIQAIDAYAKESVRQQGVFRNLSISIDGARTATRGLVSDIELAVKANKLVDSGAIKTAEQFEELARAAVVTSQRLGIDFASALSKVVSEEKEYIEQTKQVAIASEGAAFALQKMEVEAQNLATKALGGVRGSTKSLHEALLGLAKEGLVPTSDEVRAYGTELDRLRAKLQEAGVEFRDQPKKIDEWARAIDRARTAAEDMTASEETLLDMQRRSRQIVEDFAREQANARTQEDHDLEVQLKYAQARGASEEEITRLLNEQTALRERHLELEGKQEEITALHQREELRLAEEMGRRAREARELAAQRARSLRDLQMQIELNQQLRHIEVEGALGGDQVQLIYEREAAQVAFLEQKLKYTRDTIEALRISEEIEAAHHTAEMERMAIWQTAFENRKRLEQELSDTISRGIEKQIELQQRKEEADQKAARAQAAKAEIASFRAIQQAGVDHQKKMGAIGDTVSGVYNSIAGVAQAAAQTQGTASKAALGVAAGIEATQMAIVAIREGVLAAASAASWDIPGAVLHSAAAAAAGASVGLIIAQAAKAGAAANVGPSHSATGGIASGMSAHQGFDDDTESSRSSQTRSDLPPVSRDAGVSGAIESQGSPRGGGRVTNVYFGEGAFKSLEAPDKREFGLELRRVLRDSEQRDGGL